MSSLDDFIAAVATIKPAQRSVLYQTFAGNGVHFQAIREYKKAAEEYEKALILCPHDGFLQIAAAKAFYAAEDFVKAEEFFRKASLFFPTKSEVIENLANSLLQQDRFDEAFACYEDALSLQEISPSSTVHRNYGLALCEAEAYRDAIPVLRQAFAQNVYSPSITSALARSYFELGDLKSARDIYQLGLHHDPAEGVWAECLSVLAQEEGMYTKALNWAQAAYKKGLDRMDDEDFDLMNRMADRVERLEAIKSQRRTDYKNPGGLVDGDDDQDYGDGGGFLPYQEWKP